MSHIPDRCTAVPTDLDTMPTLSDLLIGVLFPCLACFGVSLLVTCRRVGGAAALPWWTSTATVFAAAIYASTRWWLWDWRSFWPASIHDRLPILAVGLAVIVAVATGLPRVARWILLLLGGLAAVMLVMFKAPDLPIAQAIGLTALFGIPAALAAGMADESTRTRAPITALGTLILAASLISGGLAMMASAKQGFGLGILCASLGGAWGASWFTGRVVPGLPAWGTLLLATTLAIEWRFNPAVLPGPVILFLLAPLGLGLGILPVLRDRAWLMPALRAGLVTLLVAGGLMLIATHQDQDTEASSPDGYDYPY